MNQNEFFNILMDGLKDFPESKLRDIISYYDNEFANGLALGKTEEEIISKLGNPNLVVNQYKSEFLDTEDISLPFNSESNSVPENKNSNVKNLNYEFSSDTIIVNNTDADIETNKNIIVEPSDTNDTNNTINEINSNDDNNNSLSDENINNNNNNNNNNYSNEIKSNEDYFSNPNAYDSSKTITDAEILSTASISADNTPENQDQNNFFTEDNINTFKPYDNNNNNNNLNDDFYNLYTKNQPVESEENNYNSSDKQDFNYNTVNSSSKNSQSTVNLILKICIIVVTLLIFSPVITAVIGCIIGLFGVAISILVGSIGLLVGGTFTSLVGVPNVPMFVANFPYPVIVLFSLGSISLSLFLTLVFYYLCKFFIKIIIKAYRALKLKGGDL